MTNRENQTSLKFITYVIGLSILLVIALFISTLLGDAKIQASTILEAVLIMILLISNKMLSMKLEFREILQQSL